MEINYKPNCVPCSELCLTLKIASPFKIEL